MKKKVYLAGPISGLSYEESVRWRERFARKMPPEIEAFSPMRAKRHLERIRQIEGSYDEHPLSTSRAIMTRDRYDVMSSDLVVFNFLGTTRTSVGSCVEVGWADAFRKPAILVVDPLPLDRTNNPHCHPMVEEACGWTVHDLDTAAEVCKAVLLPDDFELQPAFTVRGRS